MHWGTSALLLLFFLFFTQKKFSGQRVNFPSVVLNGQQEEWLSNGSMNGQRTPVHVLVLM